MGTISFKNQQKDKPEVIKAKAVEPPKTQLLQKVSTWIRFNLILKITYSKGIPIPISRWHRLYKRITHLFRMIKKWDELEEVRRNGEMRAYWDKSEKLKANGDPIFQNLKSRLNGLKRIMQSPEYLECHFYERSDNIRFFQGKYCRHIREHRGFTKKQLCSIINAHEDITKLDNFAPYEFFKFYPITPKFLTSFEEGNLDKWEYKDAHALKMGGGFINFSGYGFPFEYFLEMVSKICCVHSENIYRKEFTEYDQFKEWLSTYSCSTINPCDDKSCTTYHKHSSSISTVDFKNKKKHSEKSHEDS